MKYVAATLSIAIAIGPASALDVGLGGKAGGVGVGAGVGVGGEGASVGGGASADGVGGANLGGSVGTGNGAPSASVGAGGNVDGVGGAGASVGTGKSASDGGSSGAATAGSAGGSTGGTAGGSTGGTAGGSTAGSASGSTGGSMRVAARTVPVRRSASARAKAREIPSWPCQAHSRQTSAFHPAAQPGAFRSRHIGAGYLGLSAVAQNRAEARHSTRGGAGLRAGDLLGGQAARRRGGTGGQRRARAPATQRPHRPAVGAHRLRERGPSGKGRLSSRRGRHSHRGDIGPTSEGVFQTARPAACCLTRPIERGQNSAASCLAVRIRSRTSFRGGLRLLGLTAAMSSRKT